MMVTGTLWLSRHLEGPATLWFLKLKCTTTRWTRLSKRTRKIWRKGLLTRSLIQQRVRKLIYSSCCPLQVRDLTEVVFRWQEATRRNHHDSSQKRMVRRTPLSDAYSRIFLHRCKVRPRVPYAHMTIALCGYRDGGVPDEDTLAAFESAGIELVG